jgi:23S rRNA (adenine2503-C2)-methyltransferase
MSMEVLSQNKSLIGISRDELNELLLSWDQPHYRANQIYKWIHHHNVDHFDEMTNLTKSLRTQLADNFSLKTLSLHQQKIAFDGTEKYLWRLQDGRFIESVLIPETRRNTVCISSQVGCSLGCKFCATGTMGLVRNLTTGEIIEQVLQIQKISKHQVTNVVFMGMGEPFMNYHRSVQAAKILGDPEGLAIAGKRITISTSGVVPKIIQYADEKLPFGLAISLHAPTQDLREKIMPIAKKFPLDELIESAKYYTSAKKRNRITFEYVLLHGINDSQNQANELIKLLSPLRCKLNLIPCNQNDLGYVPPSEEEVNLFARALMRAPFAITVRKNRGEDITAACGQLAVITSEKVIYMK